MQHGGQHQHVLETGRRVQSRGAVQKGTGGCPSMQQWTGTSVIAQHRAHVSVSLKLSWYHLERLLMWHLTALCKCFVRFTKERGEGGMERQSHPSWPSSRCCWREYCTHHDHALPEVSVAPCDDDGGKDEEAACRAVNLREREREEG